MVESSTRIVLHMKQLIILHKLLFKKTSFHYGTDDYYGPSPSTSSESDDSILSEGSITDLF